ncbi:EscJ/YscJ/HrcJ family type III secretion inner membrane ring protein [Luteimonas marina]|uniref:Lipoprotein n=1 Tax=Luteimonas marina TaxID=488485 RepID=A0A5C5TYE7_9GAMM|nr:type III secretion inner membrane ring lipoprotein SctJ [Luteimonas marina]TWT18160.1 EscJ/YscJ/HrcJ family type III secretion inner membrane ring protein [Luteimonas marina]
MDLRRPRNGTRIGRTACVVLACLLLAACSRVTLYGDLEERQANEVFAVLLAADVNAEKRTSLSKTGWEIRVDKGDFSRAMQVLQARGLPRQQYVSMCDVFKKEGIASSSVEEKARYICSRQQELARTLSGYPGVVDARVHIALPDRDPLGGDVGHSSAAVVIFQQPGANLENLQTRIKTVVKDGIEGLDDINKVSVEFVPMPGAAATAGVPPRQSTAPAAMSAANAMSIGIGLGVLALLGLVWAAWGRLRQRRVQRTGDGGGIWNG